MGRSAFITGITGQDGSYLAELLLAKGYDVHGLVRPGTDPRASRISHLLAGCRTGRPPLFLHHGNLNDRAALAGILGRAKPVEVYHLAGQSSIPDSFRDPMGTAETTGVGAVRMLEAIGEAGIDPRFYHASTSEIFGGATESPQTERTPLSPRNPYACAKAYAHWMTACYRKTRGLHASNGVLYNHESPRRGDAFVTRRITRGVARIVAGKRGDLTLGNLEARRDWGFARDYVEAMWLMLQAPEGDDYVIATGEARSVREFLEAAFGAVGLDWARFVRTEPEAHRPPETSLLVGDASKARAKLGWKPRCGFRELVRLMLWEDLRLEGLDPERYVKI